MVIFRQLYQIRLDIPLRCRYQFPDFRITQFAQSDPNNSEVYSVTWLSEPGAVYKIDWSPDLSPWEEMFGEFTATGNQTTATVPLTGLGDRQFVRVRRIE